MKKWTALILLLVLLTGCTVPTPPETTVPTTVPPTTLMPTTVPTETEPAVLQKGFYTLVGARMEGYEYPQTELPGFQSYLFLDSDGTGVLAVLGTRWTIDWTEDQILLYETPLPLMSAGDAITLTVDTLDLTYRFTAEELPAEYQLQIPAGYFLVSSVGVNGDVSFFGSMDPENGSLTLNADGTGILVYQDLNGEVTIDEENIYYGDMIIPYMYTPASLSPDGEAMLMILLTDRTTSIIFRIAPAE